MLLDGLRNKNDKILGNLLGNSGIPQYDEYDWTYMLKSRIKLNNRYEVCINWQ